MPFSPIFRLSRVFCGYILSAEIRSARRLGRAANVNVGAGLNGPAFAGSLRSADKRANSNRPAACSSRYERSIKGRSRNRAICGTSESGLRS